MLSSHPRSVIIVDDEKSYTDLLGYLLSENLTCPVVTFTKPQDLLNTVDHLDIAMLVTDYYMPEINGLELIAQLERVRPSVPCVLITGHPVSLEDEPLARLQNLKALLPKPFTWRQLAEVIQRNWVGDACPAYCDANLPR